MKAPRVVSGRVLFFLVAVAITAAIVAGLGLGLGLVSDSGSAKADDNGTGINAPAITFSSATLRINGATLFAEVARNSAQRQRGLSSRDSLPPDAGMLFIFDAPIRPCFWMRNTRIPLDLAFVSDGGVILQTLSLIPHDETPRCATRNSRYGLEVNAGWFGKVGAEVGDKVNFPKH